MDCPPVHAFYLSTLFAMTRSHMLIGTLLSLLLSTAATAATDEWTRLDRQAGDLYRSGSYSEASTRAERAIALAERESASTAGKARLATSLNTLALIHQSQAQYDEAQQLLERAIATADAALPVDHPNLLALRNNLASVQAAKQAQKTTELVQRAEAINEQAIIHREHQDYVQAAALYEQALPLVERLCGADSVEAGRVLTGLADVRVAQKQYEQAEPIYRRALAIFEVHANAAVAHADVLNSLASISYRQRQYGDAESLFNQALALLEQALGPAHEDLLPELDNLYALYQVTGRRERAELIKRRASAIRKAQHG